MKLEDELREVLRKHLINRIVNVHERNRLFADLTKFVEKKQETARLLGYEQGRWDRPTNTGGGI